MHRFTVREGSNPISKLLLAGALLSLAPSARAFAASAGADLEVASRVSGVVRNATGVAQMGALVQVLAQGSHTVGTAFTDLHGRYSIPNLRPGRYIVRASATLYVPATKGDLELRRGSNAVVNLTLAALFDPATWLPAERRRPNEPVDDWKWTLRSSANRPILRVLDDATIGHSPEGSGGRSALLARETVTGGVGGFGQAGLHNIVELHQIAAGSNTMVRADFGAVAGAPAGTPTASGSEIDAGFEKDGAFGSAIRTVVSYQVHPEMLSPSMAGDAVQHGLEVLNVTGAERIRVGDRIEIEAGSQFEGVHGAGFALATHPFLRVTGHPGGSWTLEYRLSNDRAIQSLDDVTSAAGAVPAAVVRDGQLALELSHHQEFSAARRNAHATLAIALYRDAFVNTAIAGTGADAADAVPHAERQAAGVSSTAMLVDPVTGEFRTLAGGYTATGARVTVSAPLSEGVWVAAEYSAGEAFRSTTGATATYAQALQGLNAHQSQAAMLALETRLIGAGTKARISYRWQPASTVTAVDPYGKASQQAYLSLFVQQPVRLRHLPPGFIATVDVTNLLAEGYRPFLSADGQTIYFAQAPRTVQAGLSFNF